MAQKNLLLSFRKKIHHNQSLVKGNYNLAAGLWEQDSSFTIETLWNSDHMYGTTLITKTREGIDQSEGSN
ncbi:hypothetical protein [Psychrobacillus sp. FJAT-21963]|uniref:hypothetical protein n=1 Tax=Psychrobacillus sp. FJAT-21963 TaxID=1712028 RepID=UPI000701B35A|nr:hypothetical protein [Psychrobacillus sp. FJAT-21963]KQL33358.1 hypothetical protein AN959_17525 [Psychrobacillus sp. FJAT-21963]